MTIQTEDVREVKPKLQTIASESVMPCPICENQRGVLLPNQPCDYEYDVVPSRNFKSAFCPDCDSEYLTPRPTAEELPAFYPDDYHAYHEDHGFIARPLVELRAKLRARFYARLIGNRPGKLFDVGTGDCRHFDGLKKYCQLEFSGVEIKPEIAEKARQRGYSVITGALEDVDISDRLEQYDFVSLNHVIEHVVSPNLLLSKAFQLLKPGGYIMGQLPAVDSLERNVFGAVWAGYHYPRHLQAFSRKGLKLTLQEAGFSDISVTSAPHLQTALSLQNFLIDRGLKAQKTFGKIPFYSLLLLAAAPFEVFSLAVNKTGIIDFIARKPQA